MGFCIWLIMVETDGSCEQWRARQVLCSPTKNDAALQPSSPHSAHGLEALPARVSPKRGAGAPRSVAPRVSDARYSARTRIICEPRRSAIAMNSGFCIIPCMACMYCAGSIAGAAACCEEEAWTTASGRTHVQALVPQRDDLQLCVQNAARSLSASSHLAGGAASRGHLALHRLGHTAEVRVQGNLLGHLLDARVLLIRVKTLFVNRSASHERWQSTGASCTGHAR